MTEQELRWARRFIALAEHVASWSKDPSTKTGAVIVRPDRTIASVGFNGFPRRISDAQEFLNDRAEKYKRVIHCEMNAILNARETLDGYTLYQWPGPSCDRCAVHVIQVGITRVINPPPTAHMIDRWGEAFKLSAQLYREASVVVEHVS